MSSSGQVNINQTINIE